MKSIIYGISYTVYGDNIKLQFGFQDLQCDSFHLVTVTNEIVCEAGHDIFVKQVKWSITSLQWQWTVSLDETNFLGGFQKLPV